MDWLFLIMAGCFEMMGVAMINKLHQDRSWKAFVLLFISFSLSFLFLALAMKTLPMGTAYAVWTGIGAAGGATLGMFVYGEPRSLSRIISIAVVLGSAVGLKLIG
ncbi:DMT family transporter [Acetonema longum]|uniref:Multidrug resistance protein ykkd n=1 Tax=Acetonema longum DSM 6540 TaxID=1009370 RepID=F7NLH1_9FIRM|nr:multidrug efflux SMR transporter [Acetonema longum]EGO63114.1 multidrug resistance protein ykkd [Acetonema longum DSM 6540]